jgi:hypothetical protein
MVFGGIGGNESKDVEFRVSIELSYDERMKYVWDYLRLPTNFIEPSTETQLLKEVIFTFGISVSRETNVRHKFDNHLILKSMEISDTRGKRVSLISEDSSPDKLRVALFTKDSDLKGAPQLYAADHDKADKFLADAITTRMAPVDKPSLERMTNSLFQADLLADFKRSMRFVRFVGDMPRRVASEFTDSLDADEEGRQIVNMMDTMYSNEPVRFKEIAGMCSKIFPDILDIHPRHHKDNTVSMLVKKKNRPSEIDIAYEASGMDQLFRIIWKMATSTQANTIWFLDEPELHLHPGAQKLLYDFLKAESEKSKQIFVATQSMVFIYKSRLEEVSTIINQDDTFVISLEDLVRAEEVVTAETQDIIRSQLYDALGYEPKFSFEPEKIVVVEGKSDGPIIRTLSKKVGNPIDERNIRFIPLGDRNHVEKYSPILAYTLSNKKCLIILDNDNKNPKDTIRDIIQKEGEFRKKIGRPSILNNNNFHLYPNHIYSIEQCLLNAQAIYNAGMEALKEAGKVAGSYVLDEIKLKIEKYLASEEKIEKPKEILKNIWESYGFGNYKEEETGVRIANSLSEDDVRNNEFIVDLVDAINHDYS